ncbi:NAD-dependent epimerase/dehydratase family protein [Devosia sp. A449]
MVKRSVLVSGATSFVGRALVKHLVMTGHQVSALYRAGGTPEAESVLWIATGDLARSPIKPEIGKGIDVYINLAAPRHPTSREPSGIASEAALIARNMSDFVLAAKIPRTIVMSSIAAGLAEKGDIHTRRYGVEKLAADQVFLDRLTEGTQLVILRPPAVYGPGMQNSMSGLVTMVRKRLPLPLGLASEPRYYISIRNLCDLIETIVGSEEEQWSAANGRIFEPSDNHAVSTSALVQMIGKATGNRPLLLPVPLGMLRAIGAVSGRAELVSGAIDRLDMAPSQEIETAFGWHSVEEMPDSLAFLGMQSVPLDGIPRASS